MLVMLLVIGGLILGGSPVAAQSSGNLCIKERIGGNPPCTANDVRIGTLAVVGGAQSCTPGDDITVTLEATIESGPDRWAVGLWINESGGSAQSDPDGTCYRDYLHPVDDSLNNDECNQLGGPYYDGDEDSCGDVYAQNTDPCGNAFTGPCTEDGGTCLFTTYQFTATIVCNDSDEDGLADVGTCTSWDNQVVGTCTNELGTDPGTGSKCNCGPINIGDLYFGCRVDGDCDDGIACTDDVCTVEGNVGTCSNTPNDGYCDDGAFCNGVEFCDPALDCQAGTAPVCDDGVDCTIDSCNETTDSCDSTPDNSYCDNGLFCDGAEICDPALDCQAGTAPNCDDGVACTDDSCNEATDSCDNIANNGNCNDGLWCNGIEYCDPALDCQAGTPPVCDDAVGCTDDSCDEASDSCVNTPVDANCDDGAWCNGAETCDPDNDCQAGTPPVCDDAVGCTDDSCDEGSDSCVNTPVHANCDDGAWCNGDETCDVINDCQPGTAPNCNDGVDCTDDSCNEATDSCDNTPNDGFCDDYNICTDEYCDVNDDCVVEVNDLCGDVCVSTGKSRPKPAIALVFDYENTFGDQDFDEVCVTMVHRKFDDPLVDEETVSDSVGTIHVVAPRRKLNPELDVMICSYVGGVCTEDCDRTEVWLWRSRRYSTTSRSSRC
jgi:hypothetical protein